MEKSDVCMFTQGLPLIIQMTSTVDSLAKISAIMNEEAKIRAKNMKNLCC